MNLFPSSALFVASLLFTAVSAVAQAPASVPAGGAEAYYQQVFPTLDAIAADLPAISQSASEAATLFVKDDLPIAAAGGRGFEYEIVGRCGGLMSILHSRSINKIKNWKGIVLYGLRGPTMIDADVKQLRAYHDQGCKIVAFGRKEWIKQAQNAGATLDWTVDNHLTGPDGVIETADGKRVVPNSDVPNMLAAWTWTGEFVAACTRLGKMPAMYQGFMFPGGNERGKKYSNLKFHEGTPTPVAALEAGKSYLDETRKCLVAFHEGEMGHVREVAAQAAAARAAGKKLYCFADGHFVGNNFNNPYEPKLFIECGDWADEKPKFAPGDFLFGLGYVRTFVTFSGGKEDFAEKARAIGVKIAWSSSFFPDIPRPQLPPGEVYIDEHWPFGDAVVTFPGYDIKVLPPSGIVQTAMYDMICAEILGPKLVERDVPDSPVQFVK